MTCFLCVILPFSKYFYMIKNKVGFNMAEKTQHTAQSLSYIRSELNRIQTIAGTLSSIENQHFQDLTNLGDDRLHQIAVEEQSAARQLGQVKQICIALAQQVEQLEKNYRQAPETR